MVPESRHDALRQRDEEPAGTGIEEKFNGCRVLGLKIGGDKQHVRQ